MPGFVLLCMDALAFQRAIDILIGDIGVWMRWSLAGARAAEETGAGDRWRAASWTAKTAEELFASFITSGRTRNFLSYNRRLPEIQNALQATAARGPRWRNW